MGIGPTSSPWKGDILPVYYTRNFLLRALLYHVFECGGKFGERLIAMRMFIFKFIAKLA